MVWKRSESNQVPRAWEESGTDAQRGKLPGLHHRCVRPKSENGQGRDITGFTRQAVHGPDTQVHEEGKFRDSLVPERTCTWYSQEKSLSTIGKKRRGWSDLPKNL